MSATPTDPDDLAREIGQRQEHLARTVDELASRVAPKELARRSVADAQAKARDALLDEKGDLRTERVAAVGGAVAAVVGLFGALSWRSRRSARRHASTPDAEDFLETALKARKRR